MNDYKVGQILYMTNDKKMNIIPLKIVEEIIRTTLEGQEKNYVVLFPDKNGTTAFVNQLKGKLFGSIEDVKQYMLENTAAAIDNMSQNALMLESEVFGITKEKDINKSIQKDNGVQVEANNDIIMVDLGNGAKAKMNTSSLEKVANQWKFCF